MVNIGDKKIRLDILNKYDSHCAYCGCDIDYRHLSIDHIIPKRRKMNTSIRGECVIENFNPSCKSCNSSKGSMDLEKWRVEIFNKIKKLKRDSSIYRCAIKFGLIEETNNPIKFYFEKLKNG